MTDNTAQLAAPACFVDVYPFEGGLYQIQGGSIRKVRVDKQLHNDTGSFQVELAPQPPAGALSWSQVITPMSFVVIGMQRGKNAGVVMCGVVQSVEEISPGVIRLCNARSASPAGTSPTISR